MKHNPRESRPQEIILPLTFLVLFLFPPWRTSLSFPLSCTFAILLFLWYWSIRDFGDDLGQEIELLISFDNLLEMRCRYLLRRLRSCLTGRLCYQRDHEELQRFRYRPPTSAHESTK